MSEPSAPDALAHLGDEPMELDPQPDPHVPTSWSSPPSDLHEAIRRRAEEIYHRNGKVPGRDMQNWSQAEAEILQELSAATHGPAVVVNVEGIQYVGEYTA